MDRKNKSLGMLSAAGIVCWCGLFCLGSTLTAEEPERVAGRTVAGCADDLTSDNRVVRLRAARSLGSFGEASAKPLTDALESEDAGVRYIATVHLGRIAGQPLRGTVDRLEELRQDDSQPAVQLAAAFALFRANADEEDLKLLADRLSYPERGMACSAADLLRIIGPAAKAAIPALEKVDAANEAGEQGDDHVGGAAQKALRQIRGEEANAGEQPNILWISCEAISPQLGSYGDPHAVTPRLDRLAAEGVRFTRAFAPAGGCAVVRSGIITGMYPPSIGAQHMRSRIVPPPEVKCFPEYLRTAGYFCTNRSKTDYQFDVPPSAWDRQGSDHHDWRDRPDPDQPFFSVVNFTVTHESKGRYSAQAHDEVVRQIGKENVHDPDEVVDTMPGYLPDTPAARKNWAWYQDRITRIDQQVGELLDRLQKDGLADDTLVVFWSDRGMGFPHGKRSIDDTGTLVPLIMRWPDKLDPGTVRGDLVSLLDLAPTTLAVAGVDLPRYMHGRIVIGEERGKEPAYLFFHRDRIDEVYELQRGSRDRRWRYIRNYEPGKTDSQRPIEELYDTRNDPWEMNNLASDSQYGKRLARMREATEAWQVEIGDMGMIPEPVMMQEMYPSGEQETTRPPKIEPLNDTLWMTSVTEGASIVYRQRRADGWSAWQLYRRAIPIPDAAVQAKASRLGFRDSEPTTFPKKVSDTFLDK